MRVESKPISYRLIDPPELKYYVYFLYLPPNLTTPVYVGKGQKHRYKDYSYYPRKTSNRILSKKLLELKERGEDYYVLFPFETSDEDEALDVESFYISYYGKKVDGGLLYNFESGGFQAAVERPDTRKAVYVDGFVFDSVKRAMQVTGIKHDTLKKYTQIGRASYLSNTEQVSAVYKKEKSMKYRNFFSRHKKAFKRAKKCLRMVGVNSGTRNGMFGKQTAISKSISIDGVDYPSINKAAKAFGFSKGHGLRRFLEKGNHSHIYVITP